MKNIVRILVVALILNVSFLSAKELGPKKSYAKTAQELTVLLNPTTPVGELENEELVKVKIMINEKNEIIVLDTFSANEDLSEYIEETLSQVILKTNELKVNQSYTFEVKFKS